MGKALTISLVVIFVLILASLIVYLVYQSIVLKYVLVNNLKCGQPKCPLVFNKDLPVLPPPTDLLITPSTLPFHKSLINHMASVVFYSLAKQNYSPTQSMNLVAQLDTDSDKLMATISQIQGLNDTLIIAIRGTQNGTDLLEDTHFAQVPYDFGSGSKNVHEGFLNVYKKLYGGVFGSVQKIQGLKRIVLCGHSLGAAVATMFALSLQNGLGKSNVLVSVVTYACPRAGDEEFSKAVDEAVQHIRIRNDSDAVPSFPAAVSPNQHHPSQPWLYYHSGIEYGFNDNWKSVLNNHFIPVYLNFINSLDF